MHFAYYWRLLQSLPYGATRRMTGRSCRNYAVIEPFLAGKDGLEIGGPSPIFGKRKLVPVYDRCRKIDNCDFSSQTIWNEANVHHEQTSSSGARFVADAIDLSSIAERRYDFILASHVLEHVANPLQAMAQWQRLLRPDGMLLVVVPDKRGTFDHRRPFTTFEHIEADFQDHTPESDLTHFKEILALHDLSLDPRAGTMSQFRERCLRNSTVRAMHHHVFSPEVLSRMFLRLDMKVLSTAVEKPYHIIVAAQKSVVREAPSPLRLDQNISSADAACREAERTSA